MGARWLYAEENHDIAGEKEIISRYKSYGHCVNNQLHVKGTFHIVMIQLSFVKRIFSLQMFKNASHGPKYSHTTVISYMFP